MYNSKKMKKVYSYKNISAYVEEWLNTNCGGWAGLDDTQAVSPLPHRSIEA